ncbi:MAG TPA: single-stranded DNA-binding protein [Candidatus Caccousia avicola]|uniref:Single-stranded DNA-binding protein n=1 Tax=Candidatus Caccousia avicola TaxID=2840721 RepID=A0A9D1AQP9_9FIRM|nr:single-stranded DNA-binding protein [Candidatus Caccousia avicola]
MYQCVVMMGRLVADPQLSMTKSEIHVTSFRIAVDRPYKTKDGTPSADFFDVIAWRSLADFICKHFRKGKPILLQGRMETRSYTTQQGEKKYVTELIAEQARFCGDSSAKHDAPPLPEPPAAAAQEDEEGDALSGDDLPF